MITAEDCKQEPQGLSLPERSGIRPGKAFPLSAAGETCARSWGP